MLVGGLVVPFCYGVDQRTEAAHPGADCLIGLQLQEQTTHLTGLPCEFAPLEADGVDLSESICKGMQIIFNECGS